LISSIRFSEWKTEQERRSLYEVKFIEIIIAAGSKLICCPSIIKDKYQQHIYIYKEENTKNLSVKKDRRKGKTDKNGRLRFD